MIKHIVPLLLCFVLTVSLYGQDCEISNLTVTTHSCENGMFLVDVDFDISNPEGDIFGIVGNATNYGFFMYDDLPVQLGPLPGDGETEWQFIVYDLGEPNCQATYILGTYDCCTISDVVIDQIVCTGMSAFRARVDLSHSNTDSVGFEVYSATGALLGIFLYANLPVIVENIPSFRIGTTHLTICDLGNATCCTLVEFQDPDCNKTDCEIYNLDVDTLGCDNGDFSVTLDFDYILGGANFTVTGNGTNYGTFPYTALPLTLGPLEGDSTTEYEFIVTGVGAGNHCNATFELGIVSCPPGCGFDDVVIETLECRSDEAYSLSIDFIPISSGTQGFSVYTQGTLLGSFSYDNLPVLIDSFPATGDFFDELILCDNADSECCFTYEFQALLCESCVINQISVTPTVCDSNDQFHVQFDFYHYNEGEGFYIGGSGGIMGPFSYNSLPVVLGPFDGDSVTYYEFLVYDADSSFCFNGAELGIIDCDCGFDSLSIDTLQCTGNGEYSLLLDFVPVDVTHESFDVYAGSDLIGTFLYADLPVVIPEFPSSGDQFDILTVCDHDHPTCCTTYEFIGKNCVCEISEINAQTSECDTATNTFDLFLDFQWEGIAQEFTVKLGDDTVGTIQGTNLPDTLFELSTNTGSVLLTICGNGHPDCCISTEFENPCQGPCSIFGLTVDASQCDLLTNTFDLTVDFDWIGDYEMFEVFMGGEHIGFIEGANLPATIFGLMTAGGVVSVSVFAFDRPDCSASVEVVIDECRPCEITEVVAVPGSCTSDSTFTLTIGLDYQGFLNNVVDVWAEDTYLGQFSVDSLPVVIDTFPWNGEEIITLRICHGDNPECCDTIEFVAPYCGCDILSVSALSLGYCNPDLVTFPVSIDAEWLGDISVFTVYADTQLIAVIDAAGLPDTVFAFPIPGGEFAEVTICGNDDSTCCATYNFLPPDCDSVLCVISDITIDTFQCTGPSTFSAWVDYRTEGFDGPLQFWANDTYLGEYLQFHPLLLVSIPESEEVIVLRICSVENPNCCTELEFQGMHCPDTPCEITGVVALVSDPDTAGLFTVTLDFEFNNVGAAFTVFGNGNQYGVFTYNNVPLTLDQLECDSTISWEFIVQDLQNTGCFDVANVGLVYCDTVGIFSDPSQALPLDIFYGKTGASFVIPDHSTQFLIWTYDGRLLTTDHDIEAGERLFFSKYIAMPGFYVVQVRTAEKIYVGKLVHFSD
ncbi:MAG TPA: hypothetical protein VI603_03120 [Saprospiraceae bacterium]|nr:hypothetical protein [Saprospiraceae bacterium]